MYWSQDQMSQQAYAQSGATILQPLGAIDFLRGVFIPQARQGASDLKVLETQPLEALAQHTLQVNNMMLDIFARISPFTFPYETRADAARVKIEYTRDGRRIIEDFTATVNYFIIHLQTMYGMPLTSISWTPAVSSFRAPAEEMPGKIKMFQIALFSRFDNPVWNVSYTRLAAAITRENLRQQQAIFDRWRQIRQTQQEIDDIIMKTYQNRSRSYERIFDNYSQAVRGVDKYIDPVNKWDIELPTGYDNAWTNGSEYVFSDNPNFDPNVGATVNWHKMDRKP